MDAVFAQTPKAGTGMGTVERAGKLEKVDIVCIGDLGR
jgi:hypothetical protein